MRSGSGTERLRRREKQNGAEEVSSLNEREPRKTRYGASRSSRASGTVHSVVTDSSTIPVSTLSYLILKMAASQRRLEKVLAHMQPNTDHLTFQNTASSELSDNDVVIVRYVVRYIQFD